jgi:hypothetical protein
MAAPPTQTPRNLRGHHVPDAARPVIVFGDSREPHVRAVGKSLADRGAGCLTLDVWRGWPGVAIVLGEQTSVLLNGERVEPRSIWLRLKPLPLGGASDEDAFAVRERHSFLVGLSLLFSGTPKMNDPQKQEAAKNKVHQLVLARSLGLAVPRTWITNDADLLSRNDAQARYAFKAQTWLGTLDGRVLFTNIVSRDAIQDQKRLIGVAPGIFQEVVAKRCEYRVTFVDDSSYCVRIHSQERIDTAIDWRRNQRDVRYELCELPDSVQMALHGYVDRLGLRFAAVDMIETPEGEFTFLEANPTGNWLWLEEMLGLQISRAIADALLKAY